MNNFTDDETKIIVTSVDKLSDSILLQLFEHMEKQKLDNRVAFNIITNTIFNTLIRALESCYSEEGINNAINDYIKILTAYKNNNKAEDP